MQAFLKECGSRFFKRMFVSQPDEVKEIYMNRGVTELLKTVFIST